MSPVPGNQAVQRAILQAWMLFGWAVLILLAGLASLVALHEISPFIASGPYHDLLGTLLVMTAWPAITLLFRFCIKHELWLLLLY
jgi:hypothetical protein